MDERSQEQSNSDQVPEDTERVRLPSPFDLSGLPDYVAGSDAYDIHNRWLDCTEQCPDCNPPELMLGSGQPT